MSYRDLSKTRHEKIIQVLDYGNTLTIALQNLMADHLVVEQRSSYERVSKVLVNDHPLTRKAKTKFLKPGSDAAIAGNAPHPRFYP